MAGEAAWDGTEVKTVFDTWRELLPYHAEGSLGRTWQDAAQTLNKDVGMYLLGSFVGQQFEGEATRGPRLLRVPGDQLRARRRTRSRPRSTASCCRKDPKNEAAGKALLEYLAGPEAQNTYLKSDPNNVAANKEADTSNYNASRRRRTS